MPTLPNGTLKVPAPSPARAESTPSLLSCSMCYYPLPFVICMGTVGVMRDDELRRTRKINDTKECPMLEECDRQHCSYIARNRHSRIRGLCEAHYRQKRAGTALRPLRQNRRKNGTGGITTTGYLQVPAMKDGRRVYRLQHQVVMEEVLGRPLLRGENVHHKNGNRLDNRPDNLELWVTAQPSGQRPEDLVKWAYEIIERYDTIAIAG